MCSKKSELPRSMISWRGGHRSRSRVKSCHCDLVGSDEPVLSCRHSSAAIIFQLIPNMNTVRLGSCCLSDCWLWPPFWFRFTSIGSWRPVSKLWLLWKFDCFYPLLLKTMSNWEIERCPTDKFCLMRPSSWGDYTKMRREVCYND